MTFPENAQPTRPRKLVAIWFAAIGLSYAAYFLTAFFSAQSSSWLVTIYLSIQYDAMTALVWWLAFLVPHKWQSLAVPIVLLVLPYGIGLLWQTPAGVAASLSFQVIPFAAIGSVCYVFSRSTRLQLTRFGAVARVTSLTVTRMFLLTLVVAAVFGVRRLADSLAVSDAMLVGPRSTFDILHAVGGVINGLAWALLSWAYWRRSVRALACVAGVILLLCILLTPVFMWVVENANPDPDALIEHASILETAFSSLFSLSLILTVIWTAQRCGYRLARAPVVNEFMPAPPCA